MKSNGREGGNSQKSKSTDGKKEGKKRADGGGINKRENETKTLATKTISECGKAQIWDTKC